MRKKHRAQFVISHEMLVDVLDLPEGSAVVAVDAEGNDAFAGRLSVVVEHDSLPIVLEYEHPYNIYPLRKEHQDGRVEFGGWDK